MQGKHGMAPDVGWSPSSAWSHACEWGDADSRARSRNPETRASRIMLLEFINLHHLQGPFAIFWNTAGFPRGTLFVRTQGSHLLDSWRGPVSTRQVQWWIPRSGCTDFSTLAWGRHEQVPAGDCAAGRSVFDVLWHWGNITWEWGYLWILQPGLPSIWLRALQQVLWKGWESDKLLPECRRG